jgi:hypothetical protein
LHSSKRRKKKPGRRPAGKPWNKKMKKRWDTVMMDPEGINKLVLLLAKCEPVKKSKTPKPEGTNPLGTDTAKPLKSDRRDRAINRKTDRPGKKAS